MDLLKRSEPGSKRKTAELNLADLMRRRLLDILSKTEDLETSQPDAVQTRIAETLEAILTEHKFALSQQDKARICQQVEDELIGFGKLSPLLRDTAVQFIHINGPGNVFASRRGSLEPVDIGIETPADLNHLLQRLLAATGIPHEKVPPLTHGRIPPDWDITAVLPPVALDSPVLILRRQIKHALTAKDLLKQGTATPQILEFLKAAVIAGLTILISGAPHAGKTMLLNVLLSILPDQDRTVVIEHTPELEIKQPHVIRLHAATHPGLPSTEEKLSMKALLDNLLYMEPDRLVVGSIHAGDAFAFINAINNGYNQTLATIRSNNPQHALRRLEALCLQDERGLPPQSIRCYIATAIDLIVQIDALSDGTRKITCISEVTGIQDDRVATQDLFVFEQTGIEAGRVIGRIRPAGNLPRHLDRITAAGFNLPPGMFGILEKPA